MKTNKKLLAGIGALVLVVGLSSCGSKKESAPTMDVSPQRAEASFITDIYSQGNYTLSQMSDSQLLTLGYYACDQLDSTTLTEFAQRIAANSTSTALRDATYVVVASAVLHLCPEYNPNLA